MGVLEFICEYDLWLTIFIPLKTLQLLPLLLIMNYELSFDFSIRYEI